MLVPVFLVAVGTIGYHILEPLSLFDSLYLTVITMTTIGYGDIYPKTDAGRVFTMVLVLFGVFTFFYAATSLIRAVVSGELAEFMGQQQLERTLDQMHDHIIVCGYGRMGRLVCRDFSREKVPFVILDDNAAVLKDFKMDHGLGLVGDAASDDVLRHAGIDRARGLVAVMDSDANNLFTTMSARLLNPKLFIVARVEDLQSEQKLLRAGANRVVSPYQIGSARVAQAVLRPTVMDFIELATRTEHIELQMGEARVGKTSRLVGKNLKDSQLREKLKIIIVAIKKSQGHMVFNPAPEVPIEADDILIAIGHRDQLEQLAQLAGG